MILEKKNVDVSSMKLIINVKYRRLILCFFLLENKITLVKIIVK